MDGNPGDLNTLLQVLIYLGAFGIVAVASGQIAGVFQELKDKNYFKLAKNKGYYIEWPNEQDLSSDTLFFEKLYRILKFFKTPHWK